MSRRAVLITGATGFLGGRLAERLLAAGWEVWGLRRSTSRGGPKDVRWMEVKRGESPLPDRSLDAIVHAATCYGRRGESLRAVLEANLLLPVGLLEAALHREVPRLINIDTVLPPSLNAYTRSKAQFREWGRAIARGGSTTLTNLQLDYFYGPGEPCERFIPSVIAACLRNEGEIPLTSGEQRRSLLHVEDAVTGIVATLEAPGLSPGDYHLCEAEPPPLRTVIETIRRMTGSTTSLGFGRLPRRGGEPLAPGPRGRSLAELGWRPAVPLETGLQQAIDWVREQCV